jgi:ABC-type Fe3+/spermidine/putrescine transport system ATPase subunit
MRAEIKRLQRELQLTVVFVTHDQEEAMSISDRLMVMDRGRILQSGSPNEIYERPATAFIARSVGAVNFLEGVFSNGSPGGATVATSLGTLAIRSVIDGIRSGERVCLVVRPETIRLSSPDNGAGSNRVLGRVESAMYTGALIRYSVGVGATRLMVDLFDPRHTATFREGDRVMLILPEDPHLLPA